MHIINSVDDFIDFDPLYLLFSCYFCHNFILLINFVVLLFDIDMNLAWFNEF